MCTLQSLSLYLFYDYRDWGSCILQVGSPFLLLGSSRTTLICSGLSCVPWFLAAAGSVYVQGVHQCQRQGEGCMFLLASMLLYFLCCSMQCLTDWFIVFHGQLSAWLIPAVQTLNVSSMTPPELSALSGLLPQLGASFLLSLPSHQLLDILSQPGLHRYTPAQVSRECVFSFMSCFLLLSTAISYQLESFTFTSSVAVDPHLATKSLEEWRGWSLVKYVALT